MIGQILSHYRILEQLGEGGMGVVVKAEDQRLGRRVALKLLPPQATRAEEARRRFLQEARHASGLDHPNIAAIHAIEETEEGQLFIVMALVEGQSLRDLLRKAPLPWERAVNLASQVLAALAHAHARDIVHRDIKPANIMVGPRDEVKVVDFGLAKAAGTEGLTRTGVVMGTAQYLSPEQVGGRPVDPRSDLWAVGMVLYEMLTGQPAFRGEGLEATLAAILHGAFTPPSSLAPGIPQALDFIVGRALERDPRLRYPGAERFRQDLLDLKADPTATLQIASATPMSRTLPLARPRRSWGWWTGAAAGAVLAAAGILGLLWGRRPAALPETRVAIAALEDRTGDPAQALLGRLAAERIAAAIAQTGTVEVASATAELPRGAAQALDGSGPLRAFAERAGAGLVVSGAYQLAGGELEIQASLYDANLGKVVALVKPERAPGTRPDAAVEAVAQRLASGVAGRVLDPYLDPEKAVVPPRYPAYKEWLVGWELYWNSRPGAAERFERAIALDPDLEVARLPIIYILQESQDHAGIRAQFARLDAALNRMNTLDRCMVENVRAVMAGRNEDALGPIREAGRLAPGSPLVNHQHAYTALLNNRCAEAEAAATRPIRWDKLVNPRVPIGSDMGGILAWAQHLLGAYDRELETSGRFLQTYPEHGKLKAHRAFAAAGLGRPEEGAALGRELLTTEPEQALRVAQDLRIHGHREASGRLALDIVASLQRRLEAGEDSEGLRAWRMEGLFLAGRNAEALAEGQGILRRNPAHLQALGRAGVLHADLGQVREAREVMARLAKVPRQDRFGLPSLLRARIAARLGEKDLALALLREATAEGQPHGHPRHLDVALADLKGYAPFDAFMRPK
jgi:tetratricopeptide (TPR) repeat protein